MGNRNDKDEPMKTKARQERRLAKIVEMKLDGVPGNLRMYKYKSLVVHHDAWKNRKDTPDYWGASLAEMVLAEKAREMQRSIDRAILEELNGKPK
jgi:hypothetical protein